MQNWKIKRMSEKRIKRWLSDIDKLIRHYEGKAKVDRCPLCVGIHCRNCLWVIIEGIDCEDFAFKLYGNWGASGYRRDLRNKKWRNARLIQLPQWKKILRAELARRKQ